MADSRAQALSPAHLRLIDALARHAAEEYLRAQANGDAANDAECTNPVPLPGSEHAA